VLTRPPLRVPPALLHALPVAFLGLFLVGVLAYDIVRPGGTARIENVEAEDNDPRIAVKFTRENMRFGISMTREDDPNEPGRHKRLTSDEAGKWNNTCVKVDESERLFGQSPGQWARDENGVSLRQREVGPVRNRHCISVMTYPEGIVVTQDVEIVRGEQTGLLDTCLVRYALENKGKAPHTAGLRVMLDTFIGAEDGVPFLIPGRRKLLTTMQEFGPKDMPDVISALERPDPKNPGTVAQLGVNIVDSEPVEKMIICRWPGPNVRWEIQPESMAADAKRKGDSCVFLYWEYRKMEPGEKRVMGFTYGLGQLESGGTSAGQLGLMAHGSARPGGTFTVTAYVKKPQVGQKVKIELPDGLTLADDQPAEQTVTEVQPDQDLQMSWRVKVGNQTGKFTIVVTSGTARETFTVRVKDQSIFH
jgi:hypothetical protein